MIAVIFIIAPPTFADLSFIISPLSFIIEPLTFTVTLNNRVVTLHIDQPALLGVSHSDFVTAGIHFWYPIESSYKANPMAGINRPGDRVIWHHSSITAQTDKPHAICFKWFQYRPNCCELTVLCQGFSTTQETFTPLSFTPNLFKLPDK